MNSQATQARNQNGYQPLMQEVDEEYLLESGNFNGPRFEQFKGRVEQAFTQRPRATRSLDQLARSSFIFLEKLQHFTPFSHCSHDPNCNSRDVSFTEKKPARCFYKEFDKTLKPILKNFSLTDQSRGNSISNQIEKLAFLYSEVLREERVQATTRIRHLQVHGTRLIEQHERTLNNFLKSWQCAVIQILGMIFVTGIMIYGIWAKKPENQVDISM